MKASWDRIIKDPQVLSKSCFVSRNVQANTPSEIPHFPALTMGRKDVKDTKCGHHRGLFQMSGHFSWGDRDQKTEPS